MRFGWCSPGSSAEQHARCRVTGKGSGVHVGQTHICECPCHGTSSVEEAIEELI